MGVDLLVYERFKESLEQADIYLRSLGSTWSLLVELHAPASSSKIDSPRLAQPLCTAVQIALVDLLGSWGISPRAVVGHSSGEIAAAYCTGALAKKSAWRVAYYRGEATARLLEDPKSTKGGMLAVGLSALELAPYIDSVLRGDDSSKLTCACINSPQSTTVSGVESYVDRLASVLQDEGVFARKLNVPVAYHSVLMLQAADGYRQAIGGALRSAPPSSSSHSAAFFSSVTGRCTTAQDLVTANYWVSNLISQVKFSEAVEAMLSSTVCSQTHDNNHSKPLTYLLEVGPHCTLERAIRDTIDGKQDYIYDHVLRRNLPSLAATKAMAGRLVINGYNIKVQSVNDHSSLQHHPRMLIDLPRYPFNRNHSYWLESRLSKNRRFRRQPRHDFLGLPCTDWNPLKPKWRFTIRASETSWLLDHKIDGTLLYPAAGMLVMVLEAIRTLTGNTTDSAGYRLRDVRLMSALVIPHDEEGVEAQLQMNPHDNLSSNNQPPSWDFWIHSVSGSEWKLHCSGQVSTDYAPGTELVSEMPSREYSLEANRDKFLAAHERCMVGVDTAQFYQELYKLGIQFGENFHTLQNIFVNSEDNEAIANVSFERWAQLRRRHEISEHIIHPLALDGLFHVLFAAVRKEGSNIPTMVPTQFSDVYVCLDLLQALGEDKLLVLGNITEHGVSYMDGDITAVDTVTKAPMVVIRGCRLTGIPSVSPGTDETPTTLFHQLEWKPDISLLSQKEVEGYCKERTAGMPGDGIDRNTEIVSRHFMSQALEYLATAGVRVPEGHLEEWVQWAKNFLVREERSTKDLLTQWPEFKDDSLRPGLINEFAKGSILNNNIVSFGRNLIPVLTGQRDPLDLMFNDGIAETFYQSPLFSFTASRLAAYMDLLAHKASNLRIIEVGAGTGSTTGAVLNALWHQGKYLGSSPRFAQYDFTDISPSFFAKAQEKYPDYLSRMVFKTLDLERDPVEQGFEANSYDVVLAASVLHATASIDKTLTNIKKLLKPGGRIIFSEPTNPEMATIPCFSGVIAGWWLSSEEYRNEGPLLTKRLWDSALIRNGFNGLEVSLSDDADKTHGLSLMVSRVPSPAIDDGDPLIIIVAETAEQNDLATALLSEITSNSGVPCNIIPCDELTSVTQAYDECICLLDIGCPIIDKMTKTQFAALHKMLQLSKKLFWVNESCSEAPDKPEASMASGFGKTIMRENPHISFTHLKIRRGLSMASTILRIVTNSRNVPINLQETDLLDQDGVIYIPRVVEAPQLNKLLHSEIHGVKPAPVQVDAKWDTTTNPLKLRFFPGRLDSIHFAPDADASRLLLEDEVRVFVQATGINFKDVMVVLNQVSDDHIGQEFAGIVTEVGSATKTTLRPGDTVCGIASGTFRTYVNARLSHTIRFPESMSFNEASAIPLAYATAHYGLRHLARLQSGESILIHAAAGAVGQAAIQIAQQIGATIYVTVSTPVKKQILMERFGLKSSHFFSSRHLAFAQQLMQKTGGKGVDVVLNSLSGRALRETWRCVAAFGRFVEIGKRDMGAFKHLPMEPFLRNVSFCSLDLTVVSKLNDKLMGQIMQEVQTLVFDELSKAHVAPYPLTVFRRSGFEDGLRLLQTGQHVGKVIVDWQQEDTIQVVPKSELDYEFDSNATYVIAGGLGGVGRSVAAWMARNGAKYLILLSRFGPRSEAAGNLISSLEKGGVRVYAPPCNVSDTDAVKAVVKYAESNMPPIKGCIQGSMIVENHVFEEYSLEDFQLAIDPKVKGTWNLHHQLPSGMDFFVILSSVAGVHGAISQSNYAAASSFLDAFARFRHSQGEKCISLDVGIMENIGYIAERIDAAKALALTYTDHKYLRESDLHFMLKYACNPTLTMSSPWDTQLIGALTTPAFVKRGGVIEEHGWMRMPMFCHLYQMEQDVKSTATTIRADSAGSQLRAAGTLDEAAAVITKLLARRLARSLAITVEEINVNRPPHAFGVDSLVAVELLHWFSTEIRAEIPVVQLTGNLTIAQLGLMAAKKSEHVTCNIAGEASSG